ncbi:MAG: GAF domain-containing protein [Candidatus Rokubacteria bacterium]|nr:GAF domain-containing protein [Candidatus Rokubacteria bacterium]
MLEDGAARGRVRRLAAAARAVNSALELEAVLGEVLGAVTTVRQDRFCTIRLIDHAAGGYRLAAVGGLPRDALLPVVPFGQGLTHAVAERRRATLVNDVADDLRSYARQWCVERSLTVYYGVPIEAGGELVGVMNVYFPRGAPPTDDEREAIELLAEHAAVAIRNARLYTQSETRRRAAEALADVTRLLTETRDSDAVGQRVTESVCRLLDARSAAVYRLEPETADLVALTISRNVGSTFFWTPRLVPGTGLVGVALAERRPVASADILDDPRITYTAETRERVTRATHRALLAVPLLVHGRVFGALAVGDRTGRVFDEEDARLAQTFADHAALALDNAGAWEALAESERHYRLLAENATDVIATLDMRLRATYVSPSAAPLLGRSVAELMSMPLHAVLTPAAFELARSVLAEEVARGPDSSRGPRTLELELRRADGSTVWTETKLTFVRDPAGAPLEILALCRDITGRKRSEHALAAIVEGTSGATGDDFFRSLVRHLAAALGVRVAFVGRIAGPSLRTFAVWNDGAPGEDFEVALETSPCHVAASGRTHVCERGVRERYPDNAWLATMAVDSYHGLPLFATTGEVLGVLAVLDGGPIRDPARAESIMRIFAARAGAELERTRAEAFLAGEKHVLEMIASGAPLGPVLDTLCRTIEASATGMSAAVLVLDPDGKRLRQTAAPSLPAAYVRATDGLVIGPSAGSCGTAAWRRARVVVEDVATDPLWEASREAALAHGLRACWSTPITSSDGTVLGTLASYYREPRAPSRRDLALVERATHLAGIALERERAEQALRESNRRLAGVIQTSPIPMWVLDTAGQVMMWNAAAEHGFGWSAAEVMGRTLPLVSADELDDFRANLARAFDGGFTGVEVVRRRKDGSPAELSLSAAPLRDTRGEIQGVITVAVDMTEHKRLEAELQQLQKMEAIGRLAGGVAHDFNNLLTIISGRTELLLRRLAPGDRARRDVELIHKTGSRAASLTRQLLAFSRRQILNPKVLDLNELVGSTASMLQRLVREDIAFVFAPGPRLARIEADPGQMEQVLVNLVVNASDAMPNGGRLVLETASVVLDEAWARRRGEARAGRYVRLTVSDTGVGMPPEVRARIFEPFFTTKEAGKGTGLGLATVYGVVTQSGGHIEVESEPGRGTTFSMYLPAVDAPLEDEAGTEAHAEIARGTETILLVEDEPDVRELTREILTGAGYTVLEAEDATAALALAARVGDRIDLLLTDVVMPGSSGRRLAEELARVHPEARTLYMSGYTDAEIVHHGVLRPGTELIEKPFTWAGLTRKVRDVLDR